MSSVSGKRDNQGDGQSRSRRLAHDLREAIESGVYPVGSALPPLRQMAAEHQVSVNTAMMAVQVLANEGYVTSRPNAGAYVRDRNAEADPAEQLRKLRTELEELEGDVRQATSHLTRMDQRLKNMKDTIAGLEAGSRLE